MPIQLEEDRPTGHPVIKLRSIGDEYVGGIVRFEMRDVWKDGAPALKENGKARQEMVVWLLTQTSTMAASIKDEERIPARGEIVRRILRGKDFGAWIDAKNALGRAVQVGDMMRLTCDRAVRFRSMGDHAALGELTSNDDIAAYKQTRAWQDRQESLGFYGALAIRGAKPDEAQFVADCEAAYHELNKRPPIPLEDQGDPFTGPATTPQSDPW